MMFSLPFVIAAAIFLTCQCPTYAFSGIPPRQVSEAVPQAAPSLKTWLERNDAVIDQSAIATNSGGLRGLKTENARHQQICQIPRSCIIVAESQSEIQSSDPIDDLAATLLDEIQLGSKSRYYPYISNLPRPRDISLASIGGTWTDEQLARLGHKPTMQYFAQLRSEREHFVRSVAKTSSRDLAGWSYDLASSRALQGPFGRGGAVRTAISGAAISFVFAAMAPLFYGMENLSASTILQAALPLAASTSVLLSNVVKKEPELAIVPWVDMANHKSRSRLNLEYDLFDDAIILKHSLAHSESEDAFGFVTFDYGGSTEGAGNNKLLGIYGFVEEDNPNDTLDIEVGRKTVTVGRNGVLQTPLNKGLEEAKCAARELHDRLSALEKSLDGKNSEDRVDYQRHKLAAKWRKEKIKLIEEFLS